MKAVPVMTPGVRITALETADGLRYRFKPTVRGAGAVVPPRTAVTLLLVNGQRTLVEIRDELAALGVKIADPARLISLIRLFESAGVLEVRHHFEVGGGIRHRCVGCGQSCEGHLVGPIEDDEAAELAARLAALRDQADADIAAGPATLEVDYEGKRHRVLNFPGGACIFLDPNKRCRLHATWGPHAKPLPCRMFPIRLVRTETGTRVAVSPRCFHAHESYRSAPPVSPEKLLEEWGVWRPPALVQGLDGERPESLAPGPIQTRHAALESLLLALLERSEPPLDGLLAAVARFEGDPTTPRQLDLVPPHDDACRQFGRAVLSQMQAAIGDRFDEDSRRPTRFGRNLAAFVAALPRLDPAELPDWRDLPGPAADYARHCLRHFVFSREVMLFGRVATGILALSMGFLAGRWLTRPEDLAAGQIDDFVRASTVWLRLSGSPEFQRVLFPRPQVPMELLSHLQPSARP